jgi:lauroyl/myristoyl acyltransferase
VGNPVLVVVDIQQGGGMPAAEVGIDHMPGHAERVEGAQRLVATARAAGVPIVPAFCVLDGGDRYAVHVGKPVRVERGEEEAAARAWVGTLEEVVREHPTQWFNFFDVWDGVPR